jgi:cytochrome c biogenesis protein CcmG/thiol:disulfide interchange protein DsbE
MNRIKLFIPVLIFLGLAIFLYQGLGKDPQELPSVVVGKPLPEFELKTLDSNFEQSITQDDLLGEPYLLNIWATWCPSCLVEHPYLYELSQQGVKILGVNYKDNGPAAVKWLEKYKNPYAVTVFDDRGRFGFDLGVTGAPETFLIDAQGQIVYRHVGVVDENVWNTHFRASFGKSRDTEVDTSVSENNS